MRQKCTYIRQYNIYGKSSRSCMGAHFLDFLIQQTSVIKFVLSLLRSLKKKLWVWNMFSQFLCKTFVLALLRMMYINFTKI